MIRLKIKPLSVNEAWRGRRFKTPKYQQFQESVFWMLPKLQLPDPPFQVDLRFGFSSKASDIDNPVKMFLDILQKRFNFDDKLIHKLNIEKDLTKKGEEFIEFQINHYEKTN